MGNYITLCTVGDMQAKEDVLKQKRVLQIIKVDGKILEFTKPLIVRDLLVSYPNSYVGVFKEATQPLPLDYKLKIGKIYYLLPSPDQFTKCTCTSSSTTNNNVKDDNARREMVDQKTMTKKKATIKVVITKEQLQQILSKQGRVEELLMGVVSNTKVSSFEGGGGGGCSSSTPWFPKLESIPEGSDVVC